MAKKEKKKTPKKSKPKKEKTSKTEETENFRGIIRIAGKDVSGNITLKRALTRVRGISHTLAGAVSIPISKELSLSPDLRVGELTDKQIEELDKLLFNIQEHGIYPYLLNRNKDFLSGKNRHVIMNELLFETSQDIKREQDMYSWRGYRHAYGQKVRGQKTRNTGRRGMAVGVLRKSNVAAQGGQKPQAQKQKK